MAKNTIASKVLVYISIPNLSAARNGLYYINIREDRLKIAGTTEYFCKFTYIMVFKWEKPLNQTSIVNYI